MNFALPTLILLVLFVPGFLFRRLYYSGEFSKQYFKENFTNLIFPTLIASVLIHISGFLIIPSGYLKPDAHTIAILLNGTENSKNLEFAFRNLFANFNNILLYWLGVSAMGTVAGLTGKFMVRKFKLDRHFKILRFQNEWHYIFSGEILDFPNVFGKAESINFTYIDALVSTSEGTVIYSGILNDYVLTPNNGIDRIYLKEVRRRFLKDDTASAHSEKYYYMPGDFFIIPFNQVLNLHVSYYKIDLPDDIEAEISQIDVSE